MSDDQLISERPPAPIIGPGSMLDRYELVCKLADGGMASVWIARQRGKHGFEKLVAVKTILPEYFADDPFRRMFLDEAQLAARIDHTNVAKILDLGEDGQVLYIAMEWVEGDMLIKLERLVSHRADKGLASGSASASASFPINVYLRIISDACAGLHAAHELTDIDGAQLEVVHRDVSPQNILVSREGHAKIIDFGIARANRRLSDATSFGIIKGKVSFMPPEQARGDNAVDRTADIWAIGAMLYHFFAKRPVHEGDSEVAIMMKLVANTAIDPLPDVTPAPIRDVVMRALAFKPSDRFATMADLRSALEEAMVATGNVATTADVAAFVTDIAGGRVAARREKVRNAIRTLDENSNTEEQRAALSQPLSSRDILAAGAEDSRPRAKLDSMPELTSLPPTNTNTVTTTTNPATTTTNPTNDAASLTGRSRRSRARWVGVLAFGTVLVAVWVVSSGMWRSRPATATGHAASPTSTTTTRASATSEDSLPTSMNPSLSVATAAPSPHVVEGASSSTTPTTTTATNAVVTKTNTNTPAPPAPTPTPTLTITTTTAQTSTASAPPSAGVITPTEVTAAPSQPPASPSPSPTAVATATPTVNPVPVNPSVPPVVVAPAAPAMDPKRARVAISGIQNEHGVRKADVQNALARTVGAMTACYQTELARIGRRESGPGTIRIETDGSGRIVKATTSVAFSTTVARCIERAVSGTIVAGVDTGEAVASVLIALEAN